MNVWARMGLAAVAGGAAVFGMAPFNLWPVLILALAALAYLLDGAADRRRPVRVAALTGWAFGFGYFGGGLYWIGEAFYVDPSTIWMMPFAVTLLPAGMALYYAAAAAIARSIGGRGAAGALILTAVFALTEFVRGFLFTGFPWNLFGSAFIDTPVAQGAALIGVYGLTLVTMLAGFSLPALLAHTDRLRWLPAGLAAVLLAGLFAYGALRDAPQAAAGGPRVRLVQPDNPQSEKGAPDYVARLWRRLTELTTAPGAEDVTIFVWPEGVTPFFLDEAPEALKAIGAMLRPGQVLIAGSARRVRTADATRYFNSLFLIDDEGRVVDVYDKSHLVPFGEYLPFPDAFRALGIASLTARIGGAFTAGPGLRVLSMEGVPPFSPLICYEALFPWGVVPDGTNPAWLVNITDDSWFGTQTGPHQHLTSTRFRAIEEGLPVVRVATTGISSAINARGKVILSIPLQTAAFRDFDLQIDLTATMFRWAGHWPFLAITAAFLGIGLTRRRLT